MDLQIKKCLQIDCAKLKLNIIIGDLLRALLKINQIPFTRT